MSYEQSRYINNVYPIGFEKVDKWHSLPRDYEPEDLVDVPLEHRASGCENKDMRLRSEVLSAFIKMVKDAESYGISIKCVSAYRSYDYQKAIYERDKNNASEGLPSTAKPGHSEHQLGTVVDVSSPLVDYGLCESFSETDAYQWIEKHGTLYGFYISYTKENHVAKGYIWEPWHLRYWGSVSPEQL